MKKAKKMMFLFISVLVSGFVHLKSVSADSVISPDAKIDELVNKSNFIALALYEGYDKDKGDAYPPHANFKLVQILAGKPCCKTKLPVRFVQSENVNESKPQDYALCANKMPELGSRWIIFLEQFQPHDGAFDTYKGSWGRLAYSHDTLLKVREKIKARFKDKAIISYARNFEHTH
ncbi:MAG: hypothetical protein KIT34_06355 [Cyanobacteria bacterium TGS_CYA1]|nr:hypothetical protein [Cyanobacteria bacterium TGS_CYA1]